MFKGKHVQAMISVLIGAASYGVLSTMVKLAYGEGFSPAEVTGSQVLFGFAALWLLSAPYWKQLRTMPSLSWLKLAASGIFTGLTGIFYYFALQKLDASFAVLLLFQFTWMGLLADWALNGKRPGFYQVVGVLIVLAGTVLASGVLGGGFGQLDGLGLLFGLLAAASYTLFIYFSGRVAVELPPMVRSAWMLTGAAIVVAAVYPPQFLWNGALSHGLWKWGLLLSLFGMILPPYLYAKGAPALGTGLTAILSAIELPVVIICSSLLLHEAADAIRWIGVVFILAGVIISERQPKALPEAGAAKRRS